MRPLSIIIPSHARADLLHACLASVQRHAPSGTQTIVVDDASPGAIISEVAREFPGVEILRLGHRGGFCKAVNAGIRTATHPVVELLNDDTEVCPAWANAPLAAFDDPTIGAVAPLVLRWPGGPAGEERIDSAGDRYHVGGFAGKHGNGERLTARHLQGRFVFGASGSSAFYRRDVLLRLGAFPEGFGAYFEDVDLSFRLHWAGYRVWYEPSARVLHHVSASYGSRPAPVLLEQQSRNEELVFWRNLPLRHLPLHLLVLCAKAWRRWRRGELRSFLSGRLSAWSQLPALLRHRRQLQHEGHSEPRNFHLDSSVFPGDRMTKYHPSCSGSPGDTAR